MLTRKRKIGILLIACLLTVGIASVYAGGGAQGKPFDELWTHIFNTDARVEELETQIAELEILIQSIPVGPKGDTGDIGPAGAKGDTGDVGPEGPRITMTTIRIETSLHLDVSTWTNLISDVFVTTEESDIIIILSADYWGGVSTPSKVMIITAQIDGVACYEGQYRIYADDKQKVLIFKSQTAVSPGSHTIAIRVLATDSTFLTVQRLMINLIQVPTR